MNAVQSNVPLKHMNQADAIGNHINQQDLQYLHQKQFNGVYPQRLQANLVQTDTQFTPQYPQNQNDNGMYPTQQNDQKILDHINKYNIDLQKNVNHNQNVTNTANAPTQNKQRPSNDQEFLPEFAASKSDPKYQTLPYNTKFTANGAPKPKGTFYDENNKLTTDASGIIKVSSSSNVNNIMTSVSGTNLNHMTAHSTPLTINKGLATPLTQGEITNNNFQNSESNAYHLQKSDSTAKCNNQEEKENIGQLNTNNNNVTNSEQNKANAIGQYKLQNTVGGRADLVRAFTQQNVVNSTGQMV